MWAVNFSSKVTIGLYSAVSLIVPLALLDSSGELLVGLDLYHTLSIFLDSWLHNAVWDLESLK